MTFLACGALAALGALIFAAGVLVGCALAWRFAGNQDKLLKPEPAGKTAEEMQTETE